MPPSMSIPSSTTTSAWSEPVAVTSSFLGLGSLSSFETLQSLPGVHSQSEVAPQCPFPPVPSSSFLDVRGRCRIQRKRDLVSLFPPRWRSNSCQVPQSLIAIYPVLDGVTFLLDHFTQRDGPVIAVTKRHKLVLDSKTMGPYVVVQDNLFYGMYNFF